MGSTDLLGGDTERSGGETGSKCHHLISLVLSETKLSQPSFTGFAGLGAQKSGRFLQLAMIYWHSSGVTGPGHKEMLSEQTLRIAVLWHAEQQLKGKKTHKNVFTQTVKHFWISATHPKFKLLAYGSAGTMVQHRIQI